MFFTFRNNQSRLVVHVRSKELDEVAVVHLHLFYDLKFALDIDQDRGFIIVATINDLQPFDGVLIVSGEVSNSSRVIPKTRLRSSSQKSS